MTEDIQLGELVPGGQTISELASGRKVFVWGGLPGERVRALVTKKKRGWAEAVVEKVLANSHPSRVTPRDEASYLSTSPWQVYGWEFENTQKQKILKDTFQQFGITVEHDWHHDDREYNYRNKMEFSFWWEQDTGLQLSFYRRGSSERIQVKGSSLAMEAINLGAHAVLSLIHDKQLDGRQLKSLVVRASADGQTSAVLYVKDKDLPMLLKDETELPKGLNALNVAYSDPRSPASIVSEGKHQTYGSALLADTILGKKFQYMPHSFFQVNVPMFEQALRRIMMYVEGSPCQTVDFYSGVGSIGLSVGADVLVESDTTSSDWAVANAKEQGNETVEVRHVAAEAAVDEIKHDQTVIVDPPRAGLHKNFTQALTDVKPQKIIYLSCNPATQARDIQLLGSDYSIQEARGYNFFPKTPHIESLIELVRK